MDEELLAFPALGGLTVREIFAALAMQGLIGALPHMDHARTPEGKRITETDIAGQSVAFADALLAELEK